jgi:oligosaccharide translocation protein RFT1
VNYGSLVARIIFQPIEETLRVFFSRILGGETQKKKSDDHRVSLAQSAIMLQSLLSIQISLSIILVIFGSASLPILLPLLLPKQYLSTSAPQVLGAWIWYIPVLAVNGGLEAFLSSVATPKDLNNQSRWMIGFSAIYIGSAIVFYSVDLGDASLVYANVVNLSARIIYSLRYATNFFNKPKIPIFRWQDTLPSRSLWVVSGLSAAVIQLSRRRLKADEIASHLGKRALLNSSVLLHVGVCGSLALLCLGTWWRTSGMYLSFSSFLKGKVE